MKKQSTFVVIAILLFAAVNSSSQTSRSAEFVLEQIAKKLATVKSLGYTYTREFNYPSEDYVSKDISAGYLEMKPAAGTGEFRFHFVDDNYIAVYNGSETFVAVKKKKILVVTNNPPRNRLESSSSLYNSPLTLKYALPTIIADKKIPKKLFTEVVAGRRRFIIEFPLPKASLTGLGEIREIRGDRTSMYKVTVDAKTYLPLGILVTNDKNKDFTKTTFDNITERPKVPAASSWYYSSYTNEYKIEDPNNKKLLEVGKTPPDFVLQQFQSNQKVSLDSLKGKVVLLEFWIAHCGFCIAAVPKLNAIATSFQRSDFELISINLHDKPETIASFQKRHVPKYTILADGESVGDKYGVAAYPAIVLIGKDGKIAYSSLGIFEKDLEAAIKTNLNSK